VNDPYDARLSDFLDIWRIERRVCVWRSWLSRPTSSSTGNPQWSRRSLQYGLPLLRLWWCFMFPVFFTQVPSPFLFQFSSKILPVAYPT